MVKAGALGDAHVKSWDRTWSNPGFEIAHRVGLVLKLRPLVTVAGVSQNLKKKREWDGRVVKGQSVVNRSHGRMRRIRHGFESHFQRSP